jgi:hypothetical protein
MLNASQQDHFGELRGKVRNSELFSASVMKLIRDSHFTGTFSVVVQNGRILKSGYEEGYFRNHKEQIHDEEGRQQDKAERIM